MLAYLEISTIQKKIQRRTQHKVFIFLIFYNIFFNKKTEIKLKNVCVFQCWLRDRPFPSIDVIFDIFPSFLKGKYQKSHLVTVKDDLCLVVINLYCIEVSKVSGGFHLPKKGSPR